MDLMDQTHFPCGTSPKRAPFFRALLRQKLAGQLSIFFAITLVLLMTITAFIINVGLYVKAKINLQNAVDAAAWSGAAVQARQLTDIGYMNWEMRNVYKEWMFKYYVLGGLSLPQVRTPPSSSTPMDFYMQKFGTNTAEDPYPFPSICMDFSANSNICRIYEVPGLPKFPAAGHVGTDQTSQALQDVIAGKKAEDCINRSKINLQTAQLWAFSPAPLPAFASWPQVAAERTGAYPAALEIAMRIRNMEKIVNEPPATVCSDTSMGGCKDYSSWLGADGGPGPHKERTTKAYWAAMRNLGNSADSEMARSFKLTELKPKSFKAAPESLSYLLVPQAAVGSYEKYYLDLKLYLINLVTFYTSFVANQTTPGPGGIAEEANCAATKIGLPIPGYPLGFEKAQGVMTYYAVKGEVKFKGLLNPFADSLPTLTAFAAAKPFGGRIGPKLFGLTSPTDTLVHLRGTMPRSHNYVFGMNLVPRKGGCSFTPGDAIPFNCGGTDFWVKDKSFPGGIGGWTVGSETKFLLPSMIYEFVQDLPAQSQDPLQLIEQKPTGVIPLNGLFHPEQFRLLRKNLSNSGNITAGDIDAAINNVRAPTRYDALNYLIPTDSALADTVPQVMGSQKPGTAGIGEYRIYAPLWGPDSFMLYKGAPDAADLIKSFLAANGPALDAFIAAMKNVGDSIRTAGTATNDQAIYLAAADKMFKEVTAGKLACGNVAGDFASFYLGDTPLQQSQTYSGGQTNCPPSFIQTLQDAWSTRVGNDTLYYTGKFSYNSNPDIGFPTPEEFLTAWMPGPRHGAKEDAMIVHPFISGGGANAPALSRRNYYSTKLISVSSVKNADPDTYVQSNFARYTEGSYQTKLNTEAEGMLLNPITDTLPVIKQ